MRYAIKFAYDGTAFHGYQRQPVHPTVEGDIISAMQSTKIIKDPRTAFFRSGSRTDRGVSALGNVIAFNTEFKKDSILRALNSSLKNIWVYGIAEVPDNFNPRYASQRWYRYLLRNDCHDINAMRGCSKLFLGEQNFKNFSRGNKNPIRKIDEISIEEMGYFIVLDFRAPNFLWNMVRRIMCALEKVGKGELELGGLKKSLKGTEKMDFGLSPPENLILMDISYKEDIQFTNMVNGIEAIKGRLYKNLEKDIIKLYIMENVVERWK